MPVLMCFGDSNTWGTRPMADATDVRRLPPAQRWPGVLKAGLGLEWQLIEEGLPGRTLNRDDPVEGDDRNGLRLLRALLESHRPLDRLIVMLGTNDCKARFAATPAQIAAGLHAVIDAVAASALPDMPAPRLLLVAPPPLRERGWLAPMFSGGEVLADAMASCVHAVAAQRGVENFDAGSVATMDAMDGIHLDSAAHLALGAALRGWVLGLPLRRT
jgi:lysophospholipase L1-like esterase